MVELAAGFLQQLDGLSHLVIALEALKDGQRGADEGVAQPVDDAGLDAVLLQRLVGGVDTTARPALLP